jgi:hypothetical protein
MSPKEDWKRTPTMGVADIDENVFMSDVFRLFYLMICNPSSV